MFLSGRFAIRVLSKAYRSIMSPRDEDSTFQQPGSPSWPQQSWRRAIRRQRLRVSFEILTGQGKSWRMLVRKSESEGRLICTPPFLYRLSYNNEISSERQICKSDRNSNKALDDFHSFAESSAFVHIQLQIHWSLWHVVLKDIVWRSGINLFTK